VVVETGEDGEESIFSARASLYSFKDNAWKESGKGIFKFNVPAVSPEEAKGPQTKGRFIMRAHQTYRVLLNAPVFKQMKIGDRYVSAKPSPVSYNCGHSLYH